MREDPIEFVNYRVSAIGTFSKPDLMQNAKLIKSVGGDERLTGTAIFGGKEYPVVVINRNSLNAGERVEGPAIIAEMGATTVVYPKHTAVIDEMKNIVMYTNLNGEGVK
jgi:N-methylhydantoinase A